MGQTKKIEINTFQSTFDTQHCFKEPLELERTSTYGQNVCPF